MFWIIGALLFFRYAWIRVTRLFIHGFQERGISGTSLPGKLAVLVRGDFRSASWKAAARGNGINEPCARKKGRGTEEIVVPRPAN
ncbi:hypothetical protein ALC62_08758 [Cyphomyrmex costatus]|uniref:Uncharacterized protein n=1 Tax=Cyphomyrmex costatus TaxID=456900 RepID=A0A195CK54_9HYME|nr:hypothetical protein ALC62_08758 [Cyphomyrmex costatus]